MTARTRKLYAVPLVRAVTTVLVAVGAMLVTVRITFVPTRTCTRYDVMADPPLFAGAVQLTVADALPATWPFRWSARQEP